MKILFSDLDGTLLDDNKKISQRDYQSIQTWLEQGNKFVITTGRPFVSAKGIAEKYGFLKEGFFLVSFNGGLIYDCGKKEAIVTYTIPVEMVKEIMDRAHYRGFHAHTYAGDFVVSEYETEQLKIYCRQMGMEYVLVNDIESYFGEYINVVVQPPIKVNIITSREHSDLEKFREEMGSYTKGKLFDVFSRPEMLEYSHLKSNKGEAVRKLTEYYKVSLSDTIAVGDEENDLPMIKTAGMGIAMRNGSDIAKKYAFYITENDNNHSGISEIINKFLL